MNSLVFQFMCSYDLSTIPFKNCTAHLLFSGYCLFTILFNICTAQCPPAIFQFYAVLFCRKIDASNEF